MAEQITSKEYKDWVHTSVTKGFITHLKGLRQNALERILTAENKDEAIGRVHGVDEVISLLESYK